MNNDDDKTPMERFEDLGRRVFRVTREDLERVEESDDGGCIIAANQR